VGSLVRVPVLQRHLLGIVGEIGEPVGFPLEKLKSISQVVHPFPALPPDLLQLARWISTYYAAGLDTVIEAMLPAAVRGGATLKEEKLLAAARVISSDERADLAKRAPQQARLYDFLSQQFQPVVKSVALSRLSLTAAVVNALVKRGLVREETRRIAREGYSDDWAHGEVVAMIRQRSTTSRRPLWRRCRRARTPAFAVHLLHGVTGRGKPRCTCTRWRRCWRQVAGGLPRAGGGVDPPDRGPPARAASGHRTEPQGHCLAQSSERRRAVRRLAGAGHR